MTTDLPALVSRYRSRGLLVDSSLLVVYLVGGLDQRYLTHCRAIKSSFTLPEYDLLARLIHEFAIVVTTPHILTEVSNLAGRLPQPLLGKFRSFFSSVINMLQEENASAVNIAATNQFLKFGMADTAITLITPGQFLVLTEEVSLFGLLSKRGVDVLNFSHIRLAA